jgi:hypothetical protein
VECGWQSSVWSRPETADSNVGDRASYLESFCASLAAVQINSSMCAPTRHQSKDRAVTLAGRSEYREAIERTGISARKGNGFLFRLVA